VRLNFENLLIWTRPSEGREEFQRNLVKKSVPRKKVKKTNTDFLNQPVSKFSRPPIIVFADDAVTDAAKLMRDKTTGSVIVAENASMKDEPIGILTEWDLLSKVIAEEKDAKVTRVREIMSSPIQKIEADARVSDAQRIMLNRGIRRLAVIEGGILVGTVTQAQLTGGSHRRTSALPIVEPVKGYTCPYCNSNMGTRKKLQQHIEDMHEETVFLEMRDRDELNQ